MPQLIIFPRTASARTIELKQGTSTLGRARGNDIEIVHQSLSRNHARLDVKGDEVDLADVGSTNGTRVRGTRITQCRLKDGDTGFFGDVPFLFITQATGGTEISTMQSRVSMGDLLLDSSERPAGGSLMLRAQAPEKRAEGKLHVLLKVAEALSYPDAIDVLMQRVLDLLFQIMDVDHAAILAPRGEGAELRTVVSRSRLDTTNIGVVYSRHIVNHALEKNVAILSRDTQSDVRFGTAASVLERSICSCMCVPLQRSGKIAAVLYVDNTTTANRFSEEDLAFMTAFGNQAAIALENATLNQKIQQDTAIRENLLRFFPPTAIQKIMQTESVSLGTVEADVTILFSDITNFTVMSSTLEPVRIVQMLNEYFPVMSEIVFRHEGTLEKYIGDALMAVWGVPFAHDDDADRAVASAIDMQAALQRLNREGVHTRDLQIHIGINRGKVAAGNIGSEHYIQYATIGDTTNVASRLCSAAQSGEIVISESTFRRLTPGRFPVEALPALRVKGKEEPIAAYRVRWEGT
ncbi:MAG: adenylate/guanylate cyclase domain-containing protein [Acidobacteriota bacterium]